MKKYIFLAILFLLSCIFTQSVYPQSAPLISDHLTAQLSLVSEADVALAKATLHIAYGHTSHGSQITTGMYGLLYFKAGYDTLYAYNNGGTGGALDLRDRPFSGASDLGNPNRTAWEAATRTYLDAHPEVNVIIWSWCGQVSSADEADITTYLTLMDGLEQDYPGVSFVYMTGHLDGTGETGNLHLRNEQIRNFCILNNKILYDFADIESYDPDGNYFHDQLANDGCYYDSDGDGTTEDNGDDRNWAVDWQDAHPGEWYSCSSAHSKPLNANLKAYAAWYLWTGIAKRMRLAIPCDYDADGQTDIGVYRPSTGEWYLKRSTLGSQTSTWGGDATDVPVPEDYDGDGGCDLTVYRSSTGWWYVKDVGSYLFGGLADDIPVPGDYDGDENIDLGVYRSSTGWWYVKGVGNYLFGGLADDVPVPGDYNGDGTSDVAVYRSSTGWWYVKGLGMYLFGGLADDIPVPGDYDGDGSTDIALFRPFTGWWYIRNVGNYRFGQSGDIPVPGDYDGDGTIDIAVFRPSEGKWYIKGATSIPVWGVSGDTPLTRNIWIWQETGLLP